MKLTHLSLAALALVLAGIALAQTKPHGADAAIKARCDAFAAAWNQHDARAMAACWTPDGDLIDPFGASARGRANIEKFFQGEHTGVMRPTTYTITKQAVRMLGDDVAVADWDCHITGLKAADGSDAPRLDHHVTIVLAREAGEWLFVAARPVIYAPKPAPPATR